MNNTHIKGLVFDKDGTLFDFNATWGAWARDVFAAETQGDPDRLSELADALGYDLEKGLFREGSIVIASTVSEIAEAALPFVPETSVEALISRFNAAAIEAPQVETTPLVPFLTALKRAGLKLGVATNDGEEPARAHLAAAGTEALFDFIVGSDSGYGGKPAAGQLHGFCEVTSLDASACAMVGDSTHDLHAGRAAGMVTVAVLTGVARREELSPHADIVLNSIAELPVWLGL
ncbi:HAD family hydrolase [Octadecabacter ascidiaceicola]|uniref:phosphoglycolate phosphatase n=1 Tax=Octadecabacter ascidiaceicola TaxID=1655543 RepID=A0A238K3G3_9RHOB|nr:HAD family hydrolase [Octadecabacter ascidiaceicola]SMX37283.1 Phosphoglycolate phosphatase [Octadecabacter ascidiaceicola]